MKQFIRIFLPLAGMLVLCTITSAKQTGNKFPSVNQKGKTAIVAHRGFWNCEQAGFSENSIASLKAAQDNGLWGSECDIHLTSDGKVIVNHDNNIAGMKISTHTFAQLSEKTLPNGECRPSFDDYAAQAAKCRTTVLIVEIKSQPTQEIEAQLVDNAVEILRKHKMFSPSRVAFISFSEYACQYIADKYPRFVNQFLTMSFARNEHPSQYAGKGINGVDYHYKLFKSHPEWVTEAKENGMSVNVWTVNDEKNISKMIELGVDAITSNEPLLVRELLGDKEYLLSH